MHVLRIFGWAHSAPAFIVNARCLRFFLLPGCTIQYRCRFLSVRLCVRKSGTTSRLPDANPQLEHATQRWTNLLSRGTIATRTYHEPKKHLSPYSYKSYLVLIAIRNISVKTGRRRTACTAHVPPPWLRTWWSACCWR